MKKRPLQGTRKQRGQAKVQWNNYWQGLMAKAVSK